jgi:hypothetical protein
MRQQTLAMTTGFERYTKKTRRAQFLEEMEQVVPWRKLTALIDPHYPKAGKEPDEVAGALERRACVRRAEVDVRLHQSALPRTCQECPSVVHGLRTGEPVHGS